MHPISLHIKTFEHSFCSIFCPPPPPMQSNSQPAYLSNESFWRFRNTSYWSGLFSTGVLIIVIYWKPHTAGRPSDSQWLPPARAHFCPWRQGELWACSDFKAEPHTEIRERLRAGSRYTFVWVELEAWAFWRQFSVSAFTISTLQRGMEGRTVHGVGTRETPACYSLHFFPKESQEHIKHRWQCDGGEGECKGVIIDGGPESRPQLSPGAPNRICSARYDAVAGFGLFKRRKTYQES